MSGNEFADWATFYEICPFGPWRDDLQAGIVASTLANVNKKKDAPMFKPSDFMPRFEKRNTKPMTGDEIVNHFKAIAGAFTRG